MAHGNPQRVGCCHRQSRWCQPRVSGCTMLCLCDALVGWLLEGVWGVVLLLFYFSPLSFFPLTLSDVGAPCAATSFTSMKRSLGGVRGNCEREHAACHATGSATLGTVHRNSLSLRHTLCTNTHTHTHTPPLYSSLFLTLPHMRSMLPPLLMPSLLWSS